MPDPIIQKEAVEMQRVTQADLEAVCRRVNRTMGIDEEPAYNTAGGYHLDYAYGGVALYRWIGEAGAVSDVFGSGHMPKRELYDRMQAFLRGIEVTTDA